MNQPDSKPGQTLHSDLLIRPVHTSERNAGLIDRLLALWEDSVQSSHFFLGDADIERLKPFVVEGLRFIPLLYVAQKGDIPVAFMGLAGDKVEMLFVVSGFFKQGLGRRLMDIATNRHHALYVDANEQNEGAVTFYKHLGFRIYRRSETDGQGNPFPILHLTKA